MVNDICLCIQEQLMAQFLFFEVIIDIDHKLYEIRLDYDQKFWALMSPWN